MNLTNPLIVLGLAALPFSAAALDEGQARQETPESRSAATLVQKLGDKDYKTRKEAFRALERMGAAAREELEMAQKSDDPEVRWSASLLLDRLEEQEGGKEGDAKRGRLREREEPRAPRPSDDAVRDMRDTIRRLERWQEEFEKSFPGWSRRPFGFRAFDDWFRELPDFGRFGRVGELEMGPGSSFSRIVEHDGEKESVSIRVDENGRVTAEHEMNGEKTKVEADSIEALRRQHPELFEGFGGLSFRVHPFGGSAILPGRDDVPAPREFESRRPALEKPQPAPADRPRLGVQVAPVGPDLARYLDLEEGVGLEVVEVLKGSAAEKIGVRPRDVITEVNGREIRGVEDVAEALGSTDPAQAEVTVIRRGAERKLDGDDGSGGRSEKQEKRDKRDGGAK
jgi:hypothetical protein